VIDKGQELLGITIVGGEPNGIFVSSVTEESYASKYGLKYGDQLLEVCKYACYFSFVFPLNFAKFFFLPAFPLKWLSLQPIKQLLDKVESTMPKIYAGKDIGRGVRRVQYHFSVAEFPSPNNCFIIPY